MAHLKKTFFSKPSIPTCISRVFLHWNFHLDIQAASENESYAFSFSASGEPVWPDWAIFESSRWQILNNNLEIYGVIWKMALLV